METNNVNGFSDVTEDELLNSIDFDHLDEEDEREPTTPVKEKIDFRIEVGMMFTEKEHVYDLYREYAFEIGFGVRQRNARSNYVYFTCSRNEFSSDAKEESDIEQIQRSSSFLRIGCKASLQASKDDASGLWRITRFNEIHNHNMVSPKSTKLLNGLFGLISVLETNAVTRRPQESQILPIYRTRLVDLDVVDELIVPDTSRQHNSKVKQCKKVSRINLCIMSREEKQNAQGKQCKTKFK